MLKVLAFDYGASSGRAVLGHYDGNTLKLEEIHRFPNDPVMINGRFHWDIPRLYHELKQGLIKIAQSGIGIDGIGIDTWGVDYGLLDRTGELLGIPFHYRDTRTDGMIAAAGKIMPAREIYEITGIQFVALNTMLQLLAHRLENPEMLAAADTLLFIPDLLNYFLTGKKTTEYTIASTSQLLDARTGNWSWELIDRMSLPRRIFTDIIQPGTVIGPISEDLRKEVGIGNVPVIAVAGHDTASAVVSVPATGTSGDYAYLSSGTWSLLGVESLRPVINDKTFDLNYTNEGGFNRTIRLLKNIMGLWIYQECKRSWEKQGATDTFDQLEEAAGTAKPFKCFIDVDDGPFFKPGSMPEKVQDFCRRTSQQVPETKGEIVRCVLESLAMRYRSAVEGLETIVGHRIPVLNIVGGGSKNITLCGFTANVLNRPVITGPIEATAIGNMISQLVALGEIKGLAQGRQVVRNSFPVTEYAPVNPSEWDEAYGIYRGMMDRSGAK